MMLDRFAKLLEDAGHYPTRPVCPMAEADRAQPAVPGPPNPPPMACGFPPDHAGPHRTVFGDRLAGTLVEREVISRCNKCRSPWPCKTATDLMGPELTGFGPEPDQ